MCQRFFLLLLLVCSACAELPSESQLGSNPISNPRQLNELQLPANQSGTYLPALSSCLFELSSRSSLGKIQTSAQSGETETPKAISLLIVLTDVKKLDRDQFSNSDVKISIELEAVVKYIKLIQKSAEATGQSAIATLLRGKSIDTHCLDQQKVYWKNLIKLKKTSSLEAPSLPGPGGLNAHKYENAIRSMTRQYNSIHDYLDKVSADELTETISRNHLQTVFSLPSSDLKVP